MRRALGACLLLLLGCGCFGPRMGPTYAVDGVYTDGQQIEILLTRTWWRQLLLPVDLPDIVETTTVATTLPFPHDGKPSDLPRALVVDVTGHDEWALHRPVFANGRWIRAMPRVRHDSWVTEISEMEANRNLQLLAVLGGMLPTNLDAAAFSPSGKLAVGSQSRRSNSDRFG